MKIKRFFAPDMRQAINQVRHEQGPDAVILSTRTTASGVEIVAALDYDAELVSGMIGERQAAPAPAPAENREHAEQAPGEDVAQQPIAVDPGYGGPREEMLIEPVARPKPAPRIEWIQDPALTSMEAELKSLRAILQDQVARLATVEHERRDPVRAEIARRFTALGIDESLARQLAADARSITDTGSAWREAMFSLARRIPVPAKEPLDGQKAIALVGSTGVGKTTTAAKLAARACMRFGSKAVALVSTDDFRVGAQRQLAAFGLLLGVPVRQAASPAELAARLDEFSGRRVVIVDTAGMGQRDMRLMQEFRKLEGVAGLESYLVLPANLQRDVMDEVIESFGRERLAGCMLSKLDEARRIGPALSALVGHNLPVAYLSEGQRVPEDLAVARTQDLVVRAASARALIAATGMERTACNTSATKGGSHVAA